MSFNPYQAPAASLGRDTYAATGKVSPRVLRLLLQMKPWILFVAIVMTIGAALFALGMLMIVVNGTSDARLYFGLKGPEMLLILALFLIPLVLSVLLLVNLFKCVSRLGRLALNGEVGTMDDALDAHRGYWLIIGVVTLVYIGLMLLLIFIGAFATASRY